MSLYLEAAQILTLKEGSLKSRIYHSKHKYKSPPARLYALIVETLKHQEILNEVIAHSGILEQERKLTHPLALLLLHDQLLTKGGVATSSGPLKDAVLRHKARLNGEFTKARLRRGWGDVNAVLRAAAEKEAETAIPRWVRVNTIKTTLQEVLAQFTSYKEVDSTAKLLEPGAKNIFYRDIYIPNLLGFPPNTNLTTHELYLNGSIILQDRSSCIPAVMLDPPADAITIDGTAAPGNKTSHLAAIHHEKGNSNPVVAYEHSPQRTKTLEKMIGRAGAGKIVQIRGETDFMTSSPKDELLKDVTCIMLDPSCSGSGIVSRKEYTLLPPPTLPTAPSKNSRGKKRPRTETKDAAKPVVKIVADAEDPTGGEAEESPETVSFPKSRLLALGEFQTKMILHAMRFPKVTRISYSTCSVHREENEDVVVKVLGDKRVQKKGWRVLGREEGGLRGWERRGVETEGLGEEGMEGCVRCVPVEDGGIGFFCVVFVREGGGEGGWEAEDGEVEPERGASKEAEGEEEEWKGFDDSEEFKGFSDAEPEKEEKEEPARKKKKGKKKGGKKA